MKKKKVKLVLAKETLRTLETASLGEVIAGNMDTTNHCPHPSEVCTAANCWS